MTRFVAVCRCCGRRVLGAPRFDEPELLRLLRHLRDAHPELTLPADAPAGAILAHFDVSPE